MLLLGATKSLAPYITWVGVLIVAVVIAGVVLIIVRARVLKKGGDEAQAGLLDDLREMRNRGEISPEEFDAAKASIAARLSGKREPGTGAPPQKRAGPAR